MDVQSQLDEVRNLKNRGFWFFKHVAQDEATEGDVQTNDAATNTLVYMRRISLEEAEQIIRTDDPDRPRLVMLPPTSLIVRTLRRKSDYGH
jgi:hypothetical protein